MKRLTISILLNFIGSVLIAQSLEKNTLDRSAVEMQYIKTVKNYDQLQRLLSIMPANSPHWNYIPSIFPIKATDTRISSSFGYRFHPIDGVVKFHSAIDIPCIFGENIYATASGIILVANSGNTGLGNYVLINHVNGFATIYGHLSKFNVKVGQYVKKGQVIGFAGSTGKSTGVHVHYGIIKDRISINPFPFCFVSRQEYLKDQNLRRFAKKSIPVIKLLLNNNNKFEKLKKDSLHNVFLEESFF